MYSTMTYGVGGVKLRLHAFLISVQNRGGWPASHSGRFLPHGKEFIPPARSQCLLHRKLCGPHSHSERFGKLKYLVSCRESNHGFWVLELDSQVPVQTVILLTACTESNKLLIHVSTVRSLQSRLLHAEYIVSAF
jgi:hypothetical protein